MRLKNATFAARIVIDESRRGGEENCPALAQTVERQFEALRLPRFDSGRSDHIFGWGVWCARWEDIACGTQPVIVVMRGEYQAGLGLIRPMDP